MADSLIGFRSLDLRSLDERECSSLRLSRWARAFVGVFSDEGIASSSMVPRRGLAGDCTRVKLRIVMPWRCLIFRFWWASVDKPHSFLTSDVAYVREQPWPLAAGKLFGRLRLAGPTRACGHGVGQEQECGALSEIVRGGARG